MVAVALIAACLSPVFADSHVTHTPRPASTLSLAFNTRTFKLHYRLSCQPPSGTLSRPRAACAAIARVPAMLFPPAQTGGPRSCPPPHWSLAVTGSYRGRRVDASFFSPCGEAAIGGLWLAYLPSPQQLERVDVDRGLGPLHLGEPAASARDLLGPPTERKGSLDVYHLGVVASVHEGVPVIFAVGYGHLRRVTSLIYNGFPTIYQESLALPPGKSSPVRRWPTVVCGGRPGRADHKLIAGRPTTIIWSSTDHPTAIVTSTPFAACAGAAATAPAGCRPSVPCIATETAAVRRRWPARSRSQ
jgi:hypothetical protein